MLKINLSQALGTVLGLLRSRALKLMRLRIGVAVRSGLTEMTSQTLPTSVRTDMFNLTHRHSHQSHSHSLTHSHCFHCSSTSRAIHLNLPLSSSKPLKSNPDSRQILSGYGVHASSRHPTTAWRCLAPNRSGPRSMSTFKHDF